MSSICFIRLITSRSSRLPPSRWRKMTQKFSTTYCCCVCTASDCDATPCTACIRPISRAASTEPVGENSGRSMTNGAMASETDMRPQARREVPTIHSR